LRPARSIAPPDSAHRRLTIPGYDTLNDLLGDIDSAAYAHALTAFLQAHAGLLPRSLALDGKSVGSGKCGMIVTLCRHEDGRPVAMTVAHGKKEDCEVSEGRALLADPKSNWSTRWLPPTLFTTRPRPCASFWTQAAITLLALGKKPLSA